MPVDLIPDLDNANVGTLAPGAIWKLRFYEEPPFQAASLLFLKSFLKLLRVSDMRGRSEKWRDAQ